MKHRRGNLQGNLQGNLMETQIEHNAGSLRRPSSPVPVVVICAFLSISIFLPAFLLLGNVADPEVEARLARMSDKEKILQLSQLSSDLFRTSPQVGIGYARRALALLEKHPDNRMKAELLVRVSWSYNHLRQFDQARDWSTRAHLFSKEHDFIDLNVSAFNSLGTAELFAARYDLALEYFTQALEINELVDDPMGKARSLLGFGNVYIRQARYALALDYLLKSLTVGENLGDRHLLVAIYNGLGLVYTQLRDFEKALAYIDKCRVLLEELKDNLRLWAIYNNIGEVYMELGDFESSRKYFLKSLAVIDTLDDKPQTALLLNNIGRNYSFLGDQEAALKYCRQALADGKRLNHKLAYGVTLVSMAIIHRKKNNFQQSLEYAREALAAAGEIDAPAVQAEAYHEMAYTYTALREHKKALEFFDKYDIKIDEILNDNVKGTAAQMESRFENEKKQREIEFLRKEKRIRHLDLEQQRYLRNALMAGCLILLVFCMVLYNRYRLKVRTNKEIALKNEKLTAAYQQLETAHADIDQLGGLIPICAKCKRIRDDEGYWHQLEAFIDAHAHVKFKHGICPKCLDKVALPDKK